MDVLNQIQVKGTDYEIEDSTARASLENKVDKIDGKGLSSNDYTDEEREKLKSIAKGAEVNVHADWSETDATKDSYIKNKPSDLGKIDDVKVNGTTVVKNKVAYVEVPTKTSQLENDAGFVFVDDEELDTTISINADTLEGFYASHFDDQIANEVTRAKGAESDLKKAIFYEQDRAYDAEKTLTTSISDESTRAKKAESACSQSILDEVDRAKGAESNLKEAISDEEERAETAESGLSNDISAETTRAKSVENELNTAISDEVTRAKKVEYTMSADISTEVTRAKKAESDEAARAKAVEETKQETLVSGTNIKTINNQSLLGSGNLIFLSTSDDELN